MSSSIVLTNNSIISSGTIASWNWDFGNSTTSLLQNPTPIYSSAGVFSIVLSLVSDSGCVDTATSTVLINPLPIANFNAQNVCLGDSVQFTNLSAISNVGNLSYQWNFADTSNSVQHNPSHLYHQYGSYSVILLATSAEGCADSLMQVVRVYPIPVASFANYSACDHSAVQFTDVSGVPTGFISSWNWLFGDSTISILSNPTHLFPSFGQYQVQLNVTSNYGCKDSMIQSQYINPNPVPEFNGENKCFGDTVHFINLSTIASGAIAHYQWSFGDQSFDTLMNTAHFYSNPGSYTVQLRVVSDRFFLQ
jgi:PKD repeat protein